MQYRFDIKAFLLVLGVVLTSGVGLYAMHRFQQPRNASALLKKVDLAEEEQDPEQAIRFLDQYLTLNDTDAVARYRYAKLLERVAAGERTRFSAIGVYQKVLEGPGRLNDEQRLDARLRVATLMTEAGRWNDAREHLEFLRATSPTDVAIATLLGQCFAAQGDWALAAKHFEAAGGMAGAEPATYARLAQCHYQLGFKNSLPGEKQEEEKKKAEEVFQEMIVRFDKDYRAYLIRAEYRSLNMETFKLTAQAFEALKSTKVPEEVQNKLKDSLNLGLSRQALTTEITSILNKREFNKEEAKEFQSLILNHADPATQIAQDLKRAKDLAPNAPDVVLAVAAAAAKHGKLDEARDVLKSGLAAHPDEPRLCLTLAQLEFADGKRKEAIARLKSAVEYMPEQAELVVELINRLIDTGAVEAKKTLDEAMAPRFKLTDHAFAALKRERVPEPVLSKLNVLKDKALSKEDLVRKVSTVLNPDEKELWEKRILNHAAKTTSKLRWVPNDADLLTARVAIADGDWSKALPILEALHHRVLAKSPQVALIDLLLSRNAARLGNTDKQIELLKQSLGIASNPATQHEYAMALVGAGKAENALEEFRHLAESEPPSLPACLALARWETIKAKETVEAKRDWRKVDHFLDRAPGGFNLTKESFVALEAKIPKDVLSKLNSLTEKQFSSRKDLVSKITNLLSKDETERFQNLVVDHAGPQNVTMSIAEAEILAVRGKHELAGKKLDALCLANPENPEPWIARVHLESDVKGPDAARKLLDKASPYLRNHVSFHLMSILLAAQQKNPDHAIKGAVDATKDLEKLPREQTEQVARVWGLAATLYLHFERYDLARDAAARVIALRPDNLQNQLLQFEATALCGDDVPALKAIEEIRQLEGPSGGIACYCDALRLILRATEAKKLNKEPNKDEMERARDLLTEAAARRPGWPKVALLWAQWYKLEGKQNEATLHYRDAFAQGDRSFEVVLALLNAFIADRQFQAALDLINRLDKETTSGPEQRMFAEVYLYTANYPLALKAALKANLVDSTNANDHLMLGVLYAAEKRIPEADKEFAKACDLAETPEPWVARVQFLLANNGRKDAEAVVKGLAFRKKVPDVMVKLTIAKCTEILYPGAEADQAYKAVLGAAPSYHELRDVAEYYLRTGRFARAEPLLWKLIEGNQGAEVGAIRRELAIILANSGDFSRCTQALKLIAENIEVAGENRFDNLARAVVLAKQPGGKLEAIRLYEKYDDKLLPVEARYVYAQLCMITGGIDRGRRPMERAIRESKENPTYIAYWANSLIAEKRFAEAQVWVDGLARTNANLWPVVELQAQLDHAQGKTSEAAKRIAGYTPTNETEALAMARRLEEYGDVKTAEEKLKVLAEKKVPLTTLAYAAFLARQKRVEAALALCDTLIGKPPEKLPTPVVAGMALEFLGYGQPKEVYQHVEGWLESAKLEGQDARDARAAAFMQADALDREGEYKGAQSAYEDLLKKEKDNPLVLFPLARLLLLTRGSAAEAERHLRDAIAVGGPRSHLMELRAVAKLRQDNVKGCITDLRATLAEQPTATGYFLLAVALREPKDKAEADAAFKESTRRGFNMSSLHPLEASEYQRLREKAYPGSP